MVRREIVQKICNIICEIDPRGCEITENARLRDEMGLDSLSLTSVIIEAEDAFSIRFDDGDLDPAKLNTVADLVDLVAKYV